MSDANLQPWKILKV